MARPRQVSDVEILDAARECLLEHGPGVSTQLIAERVGLSQAALFKRFGTKHDLIVSALVPPEIPDWIPRVERGPDERPIDQQLYEIAMLVGAFMEEISPRFAVMKALGLDIREVLARYEYPPPLRGRQAIASWLSAAQTEGRLGPCDPYATALMFVGALQGRAFITHVLGFGPSEPLDQYARELVRNLWNGLAPASLPVEES